MTILLCQLHTRSTPARDSSCSGYTTDYSGIQRQLLNIPVTGERFPLFILIYQNDMSLYQIANRQHMLASYKGHFQVLHPKAKSTVCRVKTRDPLPRVRQSI